MSCEVFIRLIFHKKAVKIYFFNHIIFFIILIKKVFTNKINKNKMLT